MTPPTIAPIGAELLCWFDPLFPDVDEPEFPWAVLEGGLEIESEIGLDTRSELVEDGVGYPGGYCVPVEMPFDPVYTGNAMGSLKPLQYGSI